MDGPAGGLPQALGDALAVAALRRGKRVIGKRRQLGDSLVELNASPLDFETGRGLKLSKRGRREMWPAEVEGSGTAGASVHVSAAARASSRPR